MIICRTDNYLSSLRTCPALVQVPGQELRNSCFISIRYKLQHYVGLQRKIISSLLNFSGSRIPILYITCSVFAAENEEMAEFIKANSKLKLQAMELIKGYNVKADTMFAALFIP